MIETRRLLLRSLHERDVETLVSELNNYNIARNTARIPQPYHRDDALEFLRFIETLDDHSLVCAIAPKADPRTIWGVISYEFKADKNDAELGYWLSEAQWGKGLMSEAAAAVVKHAFKISRLEKLIACYHDDNPISGRILKGLGFVEIARCTSFSKAQGIDVAVTNMHLTRDVWQAKQKSHGA
jgi:RimJ/RimL family protein N-acetyltransferase